MDECVMVNLPPIPAHLASVKAYAPHLAFLASQGLVPRHDPGDASPVKANFQDGHLLYVDWHDADWRYADLYRARVAYGNFRNTDFSHACFDNATGNRADFTGARMCYARFTDASFYHATFGGANLQYGTFCRTYFHCTDFSGADFTEAYLGDVNLTRANCAGINLKCARLTGVVLDAARGIRAAGPVGEQGRLIYGVAHQNGVMIQAGCHWGTVQETRKAIKRRYAKGTGRETFRADYLAALRWVSGAR